jgi:hypothetical protein
MNFLENLLEALAGDYVKEAIKGVARRGVKWYQWLVGYFKYAVPLSRSDEVRRLLYELGCVSDADVRKLVEGWAKVHQVDETEREELIALLINLTHGARFHSTHGTPTSSFLRSERMLDQMLSNIQPKRRRDEPVGPGWQEWKLEQFLGMGTFGEAWLGRNKDYPEPSTFKFFTHEDAKDWLRQEKQALFQIKAKLHRHPNIIEYTNVVTAGQQWPFLVLEYVGGGSLEEWILAHPDDRAPLYKDEIIEDVVRGLSQAHQEKIYHRDLKPANILLTAGSVAQAKIADFGLAKVEGEVPLASTALTSRALLVGTDMYLPPEALEPYAPRSAAQDDVFALGVTWYQLLVTRLERPSYDFAERLQAAGADSHTIRLITRCLAHPSRRFADACALEEALTDLVPDTWQVPEGCFDVQHLVREYLSSQAR